METQTNISIISKTKTIVVCTLISATIALSVTLFSKINFHDFMMNILDWQNM